jgi:hypothetical protein
MPFAAPLSEASDDVLWSGPEQCSFSVSGTLSNLSKCIFMPDCECAHISLKRPVVVSNILLTNCNKNWHAKRLTLQVEVGLPIEPVVFGPRDKCISIYDRKYAIERAKAFQLCHDTCRISLMRFCGKVPDGHWLCERQSAVMRYFLNEQGYDGRRSTADIEPYTIDKSFLVSDAAVEKAVMMMLTWSASLKPVRLIGLSIVVQYESNNGRHVEVHNDSESTVEIREDVIEQETVVILGADVAAAAGAAAVDGVKLEEFSQTGDISNVALRMAPLVDVCEESVGVVAVQVLPVSDLICELEVMFEYTDDR